MLQEYLNSLVDKPFRWGSNDCYTFMRNYLKLKYNKDIIQLNYSNERSALAVAKIHKWENVLKDVFEIENVLSPENGDIILINGQGFECCHLYHNKKIYSIDRVNGLIRTDYFIYKFTAKIIIRIIKPL